MEPPLDPPLLCGNWEGVLSSVLTVVKNNGRKPLIWMVFTSHKEVINIITYTPAGSFLKCQSTAVSSTSLMLLPTLCGSCTPVCAHGPSNLASVFPENHSMSSSNNNCMLV